MTDEPMHIVLLGDSTFDNAPYTDGGPAVIDHLRAELGNSDEATLLAVDGDVTTDVAHQLPGVPSSATHLVLSVGGNDGVQEISILQQPADGVADALVQVSDVVDRFARNYRECLEGVLALQFPTAVCTIYNGDFPESERRVVSTMVTLLDDVIMQAALDYGLPIIDLRRVCPLPTDYTRTIEPNVEGGRKIAAAALESVELHGPGRSIVVPSGVGTR